MFDEIAWRRNAGIPEIQQKSRVGKFIERERKKVEEDKAWCEDRPFFGKQCLFSERKYRGKKVERKAKKS